jgi:leucyl-tRNA synthetase
MGNLSAVKACEDLKIKGQNDKDLLAKAKDQCYLKGFYEGKLLVGKYVGSKVQDAKLLVKNDLIQSKQAVVYYEPEGIVISRSGDECVVTFIDQWYINYADPKWQDRVMNHITS